MSSDQTPTTPSADPQTAASPKRRNPVERVLVWGLIIALVVVCGWEAFARFGYTNSLNSLQAAMAADDQGHTLMLDQVPSHISGSPTSETDQANRVVSYHWAGLLKDYGSIHIQYSDENEVLGLLTADAPPPAPLDLDDEDEFAEPGEPIAEIGAAGAPDEGEASGGRRRGFDFAQADGDGDGRLSPDEAPERMKERFAEIDTDGDGFVNEEELAARRAARANERGERPERPQEAADAETPSAESSQQPAADTDQTGEAAEATPGPPSDEE